MTALLELQGVTRTFERPGDALSRLRDRLAGRPGERRVAVIQPTELAIGAGEVVGLVGESGCGKSTLGRIVAGLLAPDTGRRLWEGADMATMAPQRKAAVGLGVQMIFQDPYASLNPRRRVGKAVGEPATVHGLVPAGEERGYVAGLLQQVGLDAAMADRFPHQFSGGQRARIGIARALAVQPRLLVCDESLAALDVSVQAQVLNLFLDLRERMGLTYLFISHDLSVVHHLADRVAVMYLGRIVELAATEDLFREPLHPYTHALLQSVPRLEGGNTTFAPLQGEIASVLAPPSGCAFHPRCPHAMPVCREQAPALVAPQGAGARAVACHLHPASGRIAPMPSPDTLGNPETAAPPPSRPSSTPSPTLP